MQSKLQRYGFSKLHYKYPRPHHDPAKQSKLKGWVFESERHSLAARGIKTGHCVQALSEKTGLLPEPPAEFFDYLWRKNKGVFYRGTAGGKGLGFGVMGEGTYLTWDEGMAKAFATIGKSKVKSVDAYKVPRDIKLLDYEGKTMIELKKSLGVGAFDNVADPMYAKILTYEVKKRGYDGVISDEKANGIVVFDQSKLQKVNL